MSTTPELPSQSDPLGASSASNPNSPLVDAHSKLTAIDQDTKTLLGEVTGAGGETVAVQVGQKIGKYEIRALLGTGGMGSVYLAFDPLIEREVALKVLTPDLHSSSTALQRFLGEARAIGRLNHPNVVSVYDIDQWNGQYFLVMELLSGGSVADRVGEGRLPWNEACRIIAQAARGLSAAHDSGMIHRDIKPENLMLTKDGTVKVVDFGLSKLLDSAQDSHKAVTKAGQILGTPQYMSPEQFEAAEVDARTDIYSLGGTLFRLLTARFPYHDCRSIVQVMSAHATKPAPIPTQFEASVPAAVDRSVARAMAKQPSDRYISAAQLADDLEQLWQSGTSSAVPAIAELDGPDRPLQTVMILEPSRLQGAVLKDVCVQAGATSVNVVISLEEALRAVGSKAPDMLITALQLPDGQGIDLVKDLCKQSRLQRSAVVLNSSDVTLADLTGIGPAGCLVQAPKKIRGEEIMRVVHAAGPVVASRGPLSAAIDPTSLRLQILMDDEGRIPEPLARMLRELKLFDVDVCRGSSSDTPVSSPADLVLVLPQSGISNSVDGFNSLWQLTGESKSMTAVVQIDQSNLILRAVRRQGIVAFCQRVLDANRMTCLLQACRK